MAGGKSDTRGGPSDPNRLLLNKDVYAILDGDTSLGEEGGHDLKMPYLSGLDIVSLSNKFGLPMEYGGSSRWEYVDELMRYAIKVGRFSNLLRCFFNGQGFADQLSHVPSEDLEPAHACIVKRAVDEINRRLIYGGHELRNVGNGFCVVDRNNPSPVATPMLSKVNSDYIRELSSRAQADVAAGRFDSAVTKSRTLLEETFCHVIELKGRTPSDKGDIGTLYKQVKDLYDMHADKKMDKRTNELISGLEKIVSAVGSMRNICSDSHGLGSRRILIKDYHALLVVNSAETLAGFILAVAEHAQED